MYEIQSGVKQKALKVVIYGPEGVGKSTLASQFPNALFIDTEDSTSHMDVNRLKRPSSWPELLGMVDWVKVNRSCSTLIIDTADWAQQIAENQVLADNNWKSIESPGYGAGYVKVREQWGKLLDKLTEVIESGINVVLTAHTEIKKFEDPTENLSYDRYELKLAKRSNAHIAGLTKEWADMVLFINYEVYAVKRDEMSNKGQAQGGQRKMYTTHHPAYDAKNRFGLPESLPLNYEGIAHVIPDLVGQPVPPTQQEPVQQSPVTPQQPEQPVSQPEPETIGEPINEPMTPAQQEVLESIEGPDYFPASLKDLMFANNVTEDEIRAVMGVRGHFPINTPFENIAASSPEYFEGGLVANWEPVLQVIENIRTDQQPIIDLFQKVGDATPQQTVENLNIQWV